MLREYTASFTSVKPCLYQPPPGTVIEVCPRPVGVKLHVPARSTEVIAATPAAPAAVTPRVATGAASDGRAVTRVRPPRATAAASPPTVNNRLRRRTFERCMETSCDSRTALRSRGRVRSFETMRTDSTTGRVLGHPDG